MQNQSVWHYGLTRRRLMATALGGVGLMMGTRLPARAQTPDLKADQVLERIAFGSCLEQSRPVPALDAVRAHKPDLFLFLGDNVYGDDRENPEDLTKMRAAYEALAERGEMRRLRAEVPLMATWDDHDYGQNDGGSTYASKVDAEGLFLDFWQVPDDDPRRSRPGIYRARTIGPAGKRVQIILLDTRYFRSDLVANPKGSAKRYGPQEDPEATLLGADQWRWLEDQLRQPAELRLIVSSIQVHAEGHGWEAWDKFPRERKRLYDLIRATGVSGVVFLSGDRHLAALYRRDDVADYPLIEVTSSSLNLDFLKDRRIEEAGPHRTSGLFTAANWGFVTIDWEGGLLETGVRDQAGTAVYETRLSFADLGL